jgi:hypothetical protein
VGLAARGVGCEGGLQEQEKYAQQKEDIVSDKVLRKLAAAKADATAAQAEVATLRQRVELLESALVEARTQTASPAQLASMRGSDAQKLVGLSALIWELVCVSSCKNNIFDQINNRK